MIFIDTLAAAGVLFFMLTILITVLGLQDSITDTLVYLMAAMLATSLSSRYALETLQSA